MSEVTATNERKSRSDALRNHELILQTARRLFDADGVGSVTMSAIAEAAQIGKGTLYRHFPDKSELLFALIQHESQSLDAAVSERIQSGEPAVDTLHWFVDQALDYALRNNSLLCEATNHAAGASLRHQSRVWWRDILSCEFVAAGVAPDEASYAADTVYMMLDAHTLYFQLNQLGYDVASIRRNLHTLIDRIRA
ncbi:MAG: helix-turn-helix transcriptional regulator [Chloroflexi bacterium]|jgi:AcrR family transcriptional regulator|nr:TetR/AcrR family transcriptional regulator [Chloroflexota bacterium]MBV6435004.1 Nucleoid occlusion factor SlmA [Anaerolineae bacterium]MDL1914757.1 helix-turn-helix transcriptional regulator [Anaerolineae bacterium CFX4]OQY81443.1 MAG: hypothetical protein B6D42_11180 [Anaerolineae bacterium UTCFX5]MCC6564861.1 helix-turn-helix transcriptional regulator [Chloroflexota bacterium]